MSDLEPITREEAILAGEQLTPITRKEKIISGEDLEPITREEWFLKKYYGGGGDIEVETLNATENRTYNAGDGKAYNPVVVAVPEPTLITKSISQNGTYNASDDNADGYSSVTVDIEGYQLKNIANVPTDIASFTDGTDLPMPKLEVAIEPVQEGSGDPSPENIRPILGWDEVNVNVCGVNVWDEEWENGYYFVGSSGKIAKGANNVTIRSKNPIKIKPNVSYQIVGNVYRYFFTDKDNNVVGQGTLANFTTPTNATYLYFYCENVSTYNNDISINYPSTDTSYHAYNGHTITIDLDGTRYGGTLDVVSGVLTVDRAYVDLGALNWTYSNGFFRTLDLTSAIKRPANNHTIVNAISSMYNAESWNAISGTSNGKFAVSAGTNDPLIVCNTDYTDATAFKTAMSGVQLVYELATPTTFYTQPTSIKSLDGENNVSASTGQIEDLEYFKKGTS